jgi:multimeric flavodoxin WrbA/putative sterol carrier protein
MKGGVMRVMVVNGSPREDGYTSKIIALFKRGMESEGATVLEVSLRTKKLTPCVGCFNCWVGETAGRCIFSDDMDDILNDYMACDALVLATPMYYYSFSSLMKVFLERLFPTSKPGLDFGGAQGFGRNRVRRPGNGPQKCVLIVSGGLYNLKTMAPLVDTFKLVCDAIAATPAGTLLRPESNLLDFERAKPRAMHRVHQAFEQAGAELVREGSVSQETEKEAQRNFMLNEEIFANHFEIYWTVASEMGDGWTNRAKLAEAANRDPRIIIRELASYFNPKAAGKLNAIIQFNLMNAPDAKWQLIIENCTCRVVDGIHPSPDLTMTMMTEVFIDIALQRVSASEAFRRGLIQTEGATTLLNQFMRIFHPPLS